MKTSTRIRLAFWSFECTLNSLFDALSGWQPVLALERLAAAWARLLETLRRGDCGVEPSPVQIADAIVAKALVSATSWGKGGDTDYPDAFTVSLGREAWAGYYGARKGLAEARLAEMTRVRIRAAARAGWSPTVTLSRDDRVGSGECEVTAAFAAQGRAARAGLQCPGDSGDGSPDVGTEIGRGGARGKAAPAYLVYQDASGDRRAYALPGASAMVTVGVPKDGRAWKPDIELPYMEETRFVSNVQLAIWFDDGAGAYVCENVGENTSVLVSNGSKTLIATGEACRLDDHDKIVPSGCTAATVLFREETEGGTAVAVA